ncbi:MAG: hypothetical protein HOV81_04920 [Kofleriaceae bacterium]|nr:hypothetical protein [Kofleriaceae bacterium]
MTRLPLVLLLVAACDAGSDGSATGTDGGGSGSASDDRLYPLEVGRTWTYDVTSTYPSCPAGMRQMKVLSAGTTEGRATFEVQGFCGLTGHTSIAGDKVEEYFDWGPTGWMRSLDEPVSAGHTWTTTNGSATFTMSYSDAGAVGSYTDCWKVTQNVSYTTYWIYCRGTGLVRYEMVDLGGGTIRADLRDTSF